MKSALERFRDYLSGEKNASPHTIEGFVMEDMPDSVKVDVKGSVTAK